MKGCPFNFSISSKQAIEEDCSKKLTVARDIVDVLGGKWKMEVILALLRIDKRRFKELQKDVEGISSRILSSVLKDLEINHIVARNVTDDAAVMVEYELTEYGRSMKDAITEFIKLGAVHRKEIMGK